MNNSVAEALLATFHSYGSNEHAFGNYAKYGNQKLGSSPKYNNYPIVIGQNIHGIESPTLHQG